MDAKSLKFCAQINQSFKQIIQNHIFCLRQFEGLSEKNRKDWIKVIQSVEKSDKGIAIISYLKWNLEKNILVDLPCYSIPALQNEFRKIIREICIKRETCDEDIEIVKILAPLTENPNSPSKTGMTPIHWAADCGHIDVIKILTSLTENPNPSGESGYNPIFRAAHFGQTETVTFLAPLTDNPNSPNMYGETPIYEAAGKGCTKIVKILAPLTDNSNAPRNGSRKTPIHQAAKKGRVYRNYQYLGPFDKQSCNNS